MVVLESKVGSYGDELDWLSTASLFIKRSGAEKNLMLFITSCTIKLHQARKIATSAPTKSVRSISAQITQHRAQQ